MCLKLTRDSARLKRNLRRRKRPIIAYKLLNTDNTSQISPYQWEPGPNESSRASAVLVSGEILTREVHQGFHFFLEEPKGCPRPCQCRCPCLYPCQNRCRYRCTDTFPTNKVVKFRIEPTDIVAVGKWDSIDCLVATKATMIKEES
jgi:hypothetical protein